jgi:PAS domain S-box-containing protein
MKPAPANSHQPFAIVGAPAEEALVTLNLSGTITAWSRVAELVFGYTSDEVVGQPLHLLVPPELRQQEEDVLRRIAAGEPVAPYESVRLRKSGERFDVALTLSPVTTSAGETSGVLTTVRDVSERMRLERGAWHLAAIVNSSEDAIVSKDLEGRIVSWNGAAERLFGYTAAEMIGRSIRVIIPDDRQAEEDEVLARVRRGESVEHFETVRVRSDGTRIPISLTVSPIRSATGQIVGASKIARDISDRKRAEEERQRLLEIAREAGRLKDEFLATLSHELRTPLNAIVGYIRMMQAGLLTGEKQTRAVDIISRNVTSLTQIVEDVLDVSRIVSGKLRLDVQAVDLTAVIHEAMATVRPAADAKGIRFETVLDPRSGHVSGDPERLQQVLWNLLSNAVKFTDRLGRVEVRLERMNSHVAIVVSDNGVGIPADFLPHVFERFRQADAGASRARGGLGLGLAIARHLVELQGGRVFAASDGPGKGSTFRVELPIRSVHADPPHEIREHPQAPHAGVHISVPSLHGVRILVVDDDRDALALVREVLEATGATVATVESGQEALEAIERARPDLLLADVGMPEMTGFDLIERVRRSERREIRNIPAAALTAFARSEDRSKALRSGFDLHLSKPVDPAELMAAMAALAKRASAR